MRQQYRLWAFGWMLALCASISAAQVTLDGTLGRAGALPGPNYAITADLGQQQGGNLFHSFGLFSINRGESATFSGPNSVNNIISRVTGGQVSTIDGALRSTIPGASVYLLNPAGVLFGESATLDVPGSVHVSTADYVRLGDGGRFDARIPANSVLTVAPVEAFGFLGDAPGKIEINGSFLGVPEGQTLSLIGGDIDLLNATVYAPAGRLNVAAVGLAGEVVPTETDLMMQEFGALGTLTVERDPTVKRVTINRGEPFGEVPLGDLDASGEGGGAIFIRGGQWVSQGGAVFADTYGAQAGQGVHVTMAGAMQFDEGALLTADTYSTGAGGDVNLTVADTLTVRNGGAIDASTFARGDAGSVTVRADTLTVRNGGVIIASTFARGDAGSVTVRAGTLLVDGQGSQYFTGIASSAEPNSTGVGGVVDLTVADTLTVRNGGAIGAYTWGAGDAGSVTVRAGTLLVDGLDYSGFTGIASSADRNSTGAGGNVDLTIADTLTLLNGGQIGASAFGASNAGDVRITAGRSANIAGGIEQGGAFYPSGLFVSTFSNGQAGDLTLTAPALTITDGGGIFAQSSTTGGNLLINANHLKLLNGSKISTSVSGDPTTQGGNVTLNSTNIVALNGSTVTARATEGLGGNITVNAEVFLHDAASVDDVLNASADTFGNDGTVQLNAPTTDISSSLVALNTPYLDATAQLSSRCGGQFAEERSRFIVQGRGALPFSPEEALPASVGRCEPPQPTVPPVTRVHPEPLAEFSGFGDR